MLNKWNLNNIKLFLDICTYCNAGCPQCHRTSKDGLGKIEWLPLIQWTIEDFKKAFPPQQLKPISVFHFCGTWGDPIMVKDILKICEYILEHNTAGKILFDTNGSVRNEDWWWDFGVKLEDRLEVTFDIDGINQEMHSKYRRFTDLNKILQNMLTLSLTKAIVKSKSIIFKHNENYKKEIELLTKQHGSIDHGFINSDRSFEDGRDYFINERNEKDFLEEAKSQKKSSKDIKNKICPWANNNKIVINPDGQVLPCCYHANPYYKKEFTNEQTRLDNHKIYHNDYFKNPKDYNIFYTPLSEIINSNWYSKLLPESIESDTPVVTCVKRCLS